MDTRARTHPIRTHTHAHEHCDSCHTHLCCKCTPCWLYHVCSTALGAHRAVGTRPRLSAPQTMCPLVFVHPSFTLLSLKRCVHEFFPGIHRCDVSTSSTAGWAWGAEHTSLVMTTLSQVTTSLAFVYIIFICGSVFIVFFTLACRRKLFVVVAVITAATAINNEHTHFLLRVAGDEDSGRCYTKDNFQIHTVWYFIISVPPYSFYFPG